MMSDLVSLVVRRAAIIRIDAAFRLSVRRIRHAVRIEPVSRRCLPKTGIFQIFAGDYRRFGSRSGQFRSPETDSQFAKARYWRAFLRLLRVESPGAGLVGWSERIRTRAFPIEPGLCVSFPEFGNMAGGVRRRPFAANSGLANGES